VDADDFDGFGEEALQQAGRLDRGHCRGDAEHGEVRIPMPVAQRQHHPVRRNPLVHPAWIACKFAVQVVQPLVGQDPGPVLKLREQMSAPLHLVA
jgi:hypothetical protein